MENKENVNNPASGEVKDKTGEASGNQDDGSVSYGTYKKTVSQVKNLQDRLKEQESVLNDYKNKEQELEQKRLEEQGEYKKLLEMERQQKSQVNQQNQVLSEEKKSLINDFERLHKISAFNERLPGKILKPKYYEHVPLDKIVVDPETGTFDETSVQNAVDIFMKDSPELFVTNKGNLMPSDSPASSTNISYEQWLRLPLNERHKNMERVYKNNNT